MTEHEQCVAIMRAKNETALELDPSRTALIVVDMQRYFTQPEFPLTAIYERMSPGVCAGYLSRVSQTVIPRIQQLLTCFRNSRSSVVFTAIGSKATDGNDLPAWLRSYDAAGLSIIGNRVWPPVGDVSWEIDEALAPQPGETVLNKLSAGTFATTDLEQQLRGKGIDTVVVCGVVTDVCVSSTAREAADRNFKVVVVSDACTTFSEQLHQANIETLQVFGSVRRTEDVIAIMRKAHAAV